MSREDVERVRAGFEALGAGGVEAFLDYVHPEFETMTPKEEVRFVGADFLDGGDCVVETFPDRDGALAAAGLEG